MFRVSQLSVIGALAIASPALANPLQPEQSQPTKEPQQLQDIQRPATTIGEWLSQALIPTVITNIRLKPSEGELEIILETADGKTLQGTLKRESATSQQPNQRLIITIPNAQLQTEVRQDKPTPDITSLIATNSTASSVQLMITAAKGIPIEGDIIASGTGLAVNVFTESEDEITVTAEKREDTLQNVPISITAFPRQELEDAQIDSLQSIANSTPNFTFLKGSTGASYFDYYSIRGLSNFNFLASQDNVAFYIDDVPYDYGGFLDGTLFDLERVEVLRGPQSTLYGRSSQAGVVNIISRPPSNQPEIRTSASYGNYNARNLQLSLSDAIIQDQLFFRLAGVYRARDGIVENTFLDRNVGEKNGLAGRAQILWTPSREWNISFNGTVNSDQDGSPIFAPRDTSNPFKVAQDFNGFHRLDNNTQALKIAYDGAGFQAVSTTTRRSTRQDFATEADYTPADLFTGVGAFDSTVWAQEVRFQSPKQADRIRWTVGGYFESREFNTIRDGISLSSQGAAAFGAPSAGTNNVSAEQQRYTYAAFGQMDFKPIEPLTLFAGLRYETSSVEMARRRIFTISGVGDVPLSPTESGLEEKSDAIIPRFGAQYRFSPNVMAYGTIAKGYRPSGFNYRSDTEATRRFAEEFSWNYELGVKTSWLNNRLTANLAFFQIDASNYQVALADTTGFFSNIANADIKSTGFELEMRAEPIRGLNLIAGVGYTNARFERYSNPFTGQNFNGNKVPVAPNFTYNLAAQYRSPGGIFARVDLVGSGTTFFDDANQIRQKPYALVNARLGYESNNWGVYVFANNLFNTRYITQGFVFPPPNVIAAFGDPVTYGFQIRASF
ncbi:TonB-dependent receptor domain-containing protein [Leptolyngbya sp. AN03gr2]|uniref:TonB-dependent receptor domain-containing protein n=1 Tax=unclassified Leptolyngbya TaxID=2650499 RepID=UPI003D31F74B